MQASVFEGGFLIWESVMSAKGGYPVLQLNIAKEFNRSFVGLLN